MHTRVMELGVGGFMLVGFMAIVLLILDVSGFTPSSGEEGYKVYARFENVGGLTTRAKVSMSGVIIGKVTNIHIDKQYLEALVEMEINPDIDYLSVDSSAAILTAGLLGSQYIGVVPGADDAVLTDGEFIEDTQSALILEELIGKFLFNKVSE